MSMLKISLVAATALASGSISGSETNTLSSLPTVPEVPDNYRYQHINVLGGCRDDAGCWDNTSVSESTLWCRRCNGTGKVCTKSGTCKPHKESHRNKWHKPCPEGCRSLGITNPASDISTSEPDLDALTLSLEESMRDMKRTVRQANGAAEMKHDHEHRQAMNSIRRGVAQRSQARAQRDQERARAAASRTSDPSRGFAAEYIAAEDRREKNSYLGRLDAGLKGMVGDAENFCTRAEKSAKAAYKRCDNADDTDAQIGEELNRFGNYVKGWFE